MHNQVGSCAILLYHANPITVMKAQQSEHHIVIWWITAALWPQEWKNRGNNMDCVELGSIHHGLMELEKWALLVHWLSYWGPDKMAAFPQTTISNAFSWMKMFKLRLRFLWINNIPSFVQIMAWCKPGDKPLSEPIMVSLLTHICVTRPQWVKLLLTQDCGILL